MYSIEFIYYSLVFAGVAIIAITMGISSAIIGYLLGYSLIVAGYIILLGYLLFKLSGKLDFSTFLSVVGPLLAIVGVSIYYLSVVGIYNKRISDGIVAPSYYSFSNIFLTMILLQTFVFYKAMQDKQFKREDTINKMVSTLSYLLSLISVLVVISIHIILAYFSTDG